MSFLQGTDNTLEIADGTIDNCIWLTYEQADAIYRVLREEHRRKNLSTGRYKRKIIDLVNNPWSKWDISKPIIYKFDGKHGMYRIPHRLYTYHMVYVWLKQYSRSGTVNSKSFIGNILLRIHRTK